MGAGWRLRPDSVGGRQLLTPRSGRLPALDAVQYKNARVTISDNLIQVTPSPGSGSPWGVLAYGCAYSDDRFRQDYGGATFWMRGVRITGNQIRCAWDTGIYLHCADRATVSENRIRTLYPGSSSETAVSAEPEPLRRHRQR